MPRSGETYGFPGTAGTWIYPVAADTFDITGWTALINDIANELTGSLARAGGTMSGVLLGYAGAVGAPGYSFSGDSNTGIYNPVADFMTFVAGGVAKARVQSGAGLELEVLRSAAWRAVVDVSSTQTISAALTFSGTLTSSSGTIAGSWAGTPTFSGAVTLGAGGTLTGTFTSSSATLAGTFAGTPTFSGAAIFSGTVSFTGSPAFTVGTPTFANGVTVNGGAVAMASAASVSVPTVAGTADNDTSAASTAFVQAVAALKANLASPTFTGTLTAAAATFTGTFTLGRVMKAPLSIIIDGTAGTISSQNGSATLAKNATGDYTITHGLGTASYTVSIATEAYTGTTGTLGMLGATHDATECDILISQASASNLRDAVFMVTFHPWA